MSQLIILGRGPSAKSYDWRNHTLPVMAVSGGLDAYPKWRGRPEHFISLDRPRFFPANFRQDQYTVKHIPYNAMSLTNQISEQWSRYPGIKQFPYQVGSEPNFTGSGPVFIGPVAQNYSLLAAVQVAPRLGYDEIIFVGVDLVSSDPTEKAHVPIAAVMRDWYPLAQEAGIEWTVATAPSALSDFLPHYEMAAA